MNNLNLSNIICANRGRIAEAVSTGAALLSLH